MSSHPIPRRRMAGTALALLLVTGAPSIAAAVPERLLISEASDKVVETAAGETREILLADGGSVLVGPRSRLIVRRFRWDAAGRTGELEISLDRGAIRIIGGALNRSQSIAILAGGATMRLANGGAFVSATPEDVRATLQFGGTLAISAGGRAVVLERPGFAVMVSGGRIAEPRRQSLAEIRAEMLSISPALATQRSGAAPEPQVAVSRDRPDEGAATRGDSLALVPPDPIAFASRDAALFVEDLQLGLAAIGVATAAGSASTGDSPDDILLVQDRIQGRIEDTPYAAFRDRNATTSLLLPLPTLDYAINSTTASPLFGPSDQPLVYLFSSGLRELLRLNQIESIVANTGLFVPVEPTAIDAAAVPAFIDVFGERYTTTDGGATYLAGDRTIFRSVSAGKDVYSIAPVLPDRSRYTSPLFVVTRSNAVTLGDNGQFFGNELVLPASIFGDSGRVTTSVAGRSPARAFNSTLSDDEEVAAFAAFTASAPSSYAEASQSLVRYVDSQVFVSPVEIATGTGFASSDEVTVATIQSGFFLPDDPAERGGRGVDNFLFVQVMDAGKHSIVYAAGDVSRLDATVSTPATIDSFALTRGLLDGGDLARSEAPTTRFRAFLPDSSVAGLPLSQIAQTSLLVANPAYSGEATTRSRLFHADLGIAADGRASTVSATFGTLDYDEQGLPDRTPDRGAQLAEINGDPIVPPQLVRDPRARVTVSGGTVGATRTGNGGATLFSSPLLATSTGGGRLWRTDAGDALRAGRAGYLVLGNASGAASDPVSGGLSSTLGASDGDGFGYLRLAAGVGSTADLDRIGSDKSGSFAGRVAGIVEREDGAGAVAAAPYLASIDLSLDAEANTAGALIVDPGDTVAPLSFGSRAATTANGTYVDGAHYGAATASGTAAIIAGEGVKTGLGTANAAKIATYQHLQWGFFFGDVAVAGAARARTALSSWVAGRPYTGASCATLGGGADCGIRGSAQYTGHAIGAVLDAADPGVRQVVGSFTQSWNLDARTGTMALSFDQADYAFSRLAITGQSRLAYDGLSGRVRVAGEDRQGRVAGELVDVQQSVPLGSIGTFEIRSASGGYQANGTFGGDRSD